MYKVIATILLCVISVHVFVSMVHFLHEDNWLMIAGSFITFVMAGLSLVLIDLNSN